MGEGSGEGQQLVGIGAGGDPDRLDLAGEEPPFQRDFVGNDVPLDPGFDLQRSGLDGGDGGRERQVLRRVVAGLGTQQRDQVAEAFDEDGLGVQGSLSRGVAASCIVGDGAASGPVVTTRRTA